MTKKKFILLPILWLSDLAIEIEEQNEKNAKLGLEKYEIPKDEVITKYVAFFEISHIVPHKYYENDYCKIITFTGEEFICNMNQFDVLDKITKEFNND